jgi:hypothetical protein
VNAVEKVRYLDRRLSNDSPGVTAAYDGTSTTTWTLPYAVAVNGSQGTLVVCRRSPALLLPVTRPAPNQIAVTGYGDLTAADVYIGILYNFLYQPTRIYLRGEDGTPEVGGRMRLNSINVHYADTTDMTITVATTGRAPRNTPMSAPTPENGKVPVSIQARHDTVEVTIENNTPGPCALLGIEWEGFYHTRSKRL